MRRSDLASADRVPPPWRTESSTESPTESQTNAAHGDPDLVTLSGSAANRPRAYTDWIIRESRRTIDAIRTDGKLPDWVHAARDIRLISAAIAAYARAQDGQLPPDLAATLSYAPDILEFSKPAARAAIYLSPQDETVAQIPASSDPQVLADWLRTHASYAYLGSATLTTTQAQNAESWILIDGALNQAYRMRLPEMEVEMVPFAGPSGLNAWGPKDWLAGEVPKSRDQLKAAREQPK